MPPFPRMIAPMAILAVVTSGCFSTTPPDPLSATPQMLSNDYCGVKTSVDLVSGQTWRAGLVQITNDETTLYITYRMDSHWNLAEVHADAAVSLDDLPLTKTGMPKVGRFRQSASAPATDGHTFAIALDEYRDAGTSDLIVVAHADVETVTGDRRESAWADGEEISSPGSWWTYVTYRIQPCATGPVQVDPDEGGTAIASNGASVTVAPGTFSAPVVIDIVPLESAGLEAPTTEFNPLGAVEVVLRTGSGAEFSAIPELPLVVSIPTQQAVAPDSTIIIAVQTTVDSLDNPARQVPRFVPEATARVEDGFLVSETGALSGLFRGGILAFLAPREMTSAVSTQQTGAGGFVTGTVLDPKGRPRSGAVVSNSSNQLVARSGADGTYATYISSSTAKLTAFDTFRGSVGDTLASLLGSGVAFADIKLEPFPAAPNTRPGIRNGGFENGDLGSVERWQTEGAATSVLELVCTGGTIRPVEGLRMADINTGTNAAGGVGSALKQVFQVPAGVTELRFAYNFVSEEFPEFVGSVFDDSFSVSVKTPFGFSDVEIPVVSVNNNSGYQLVGDCQFPNGDSTAGMTGWREVSIPIPDGLTTGGYDAEVEFVFAANDAGDNIYDTHVLIDNIRFSTVWLDVKALGRSQRIAIEDAVRGANDILSQAGVNLRLRRSVVEVPVDPPPSRFWEIDVAYGALGTNCDGKLCLTDEMRDVLELSRSGVNTDINVYYASWSGGTWGIAVGPDDFGDVDLLSNAGILIRGLEPDSLSGCAEFFNGRNLAHEIGHLLIPGRGGSFPEHWTIGTFMTPTDTLCTGSNNLIPFQSELINTSPLLKR